MDDYLKTHERLGWVFGKEIVFVVGATRWGTAWVQQCLDAHPEVSCKGEGHFTDSLFPALAKAFDAYNADAEAVGNRLQAAGLAGNAAGLTVGDVDHLMATAIGLMFDRWTRDVSTPVIAEKTPEHVVSLDLLARIIPGVKVVHVYRDGRDEAVSAYDFNRSLSQGAFAKRHPTLGHYARAFCTNWQKSVTGAHRFGRKHRGWCLELRAEDVVEDDVAAIRPLFAFVGADAGDRFVKPAAEAAWEKAPLDVDVGSWKRAFDAETAKEFTRQAGELLKLLGYEA